MINRGKRVVRNELINDGKYKVYQNALSPLGTYNKFNREENKMFLISAGAAGQIGYSSDKFWAADDCFTFNCLYNLNERFWDINANTKIEMYQDKIIISSPGGLDGDMTKEDYIKGNYSYLRNPIIANVFRRLNIIEAFATGIKRINEAYKNAYVKPTYNVTPSAISITLPVIEDYSLSLNEAKVIDSMKDNYLYSRSDIEKISGFTKDKLIRLLASLQEKGLIEKSGKGRATYYKKK